MKTDLGQPIAGMLAITGSQFTCKIGDTRDQILADNPTLTQDEINEVFRITREQKQGQDDDPFHKHNLLY